MVLMGCVKAFAFFWSLLTSPWVPRERTSITDNGWFSRYYGWLSEDPRFERFRRDPAHLVIVEPTPRADARRHLARVLSQTPGYEVRLERFRAGDAVGAPLTAEFAPHGRFAPDTLRYMRYLSDCEVRFGDLGGAVVVEIGVGYGGACRVFLERFALARYVLVDLPGPLLMARRYLTRTLGAARVARDVAFIAAPARGARAEGLPERSGLALSTMAFSECDRVVQEGYIDSVLARADRGYLHHNELSGSFGVRSLTLEELARRLPGRVKVEDADLTVWDARDRVVTWETR